jgi:hypothetical protein
MNCPGARKDGPLFFVLLIKQLFGSTQVSQPKGESFLIDDVEAVEKAERDLDRFISRRSASQEEAEALEEMWRASERRHRLKIRLANGHAWVAYFDRLALCCERRADEYRDRSREVSAMVDALNEGEGVRTY